MTSTTTARFFAKPCANWRDESVVGIVLICGRDGACPVSSNAVMPRRGKPRLYRKCFEPIRSLPLILFLFPHETISWKVQRTDRILPATDQLRPDRTAAATVARTPQASHRSAGHPQRQSRHTELERAHVHHRPPERALHRSDPDLRRCRTRPTAARDDRMRKSRRDVTAAAI